MIKQIGTVEILRTRTYPLDGDTDFPEAQALVSPGTYPVYRDFEATFWVMDGVLNGGGVQTLGDGLFGILAGGADVETDIAVRFPSRRLGSERFAEQLVEATA